MKKLFLKYPNFIAYVVGHIHENEITPHKAKGGKSGFWEIATAAEIDWPQQGRLIEVMDNRDGTLSIFGTVVDTAAPIATPAPRRAPRTCSPTRSSARSAAGSRRTTRRSAFDGSVSAHAEGKPKDRNVELLLRDPLEARARAAARSAHRSRARSAPR